MKKRLRNFGLIASAFVFCCSMQSCLNDDDNDYNLRFPNALVTVKPIDENSFYLQLDDSTTLQPHNMTKSPFGMKEVRALVNYEETNVPYAGHSKVVDINWIDSILTKKMAPFLAIGNDLVYGKDPVEMINDWVTIAEDGYLTLRFRTNFGNTGTKHSVNLIEDKLSAEQYVVEFHHNANGDINGRLADGLVAFKLDSLPDTKGKTVKLKLVWNSFSGKKSALFNYCTNRSTPAKKSVSIDRGTLLLE